MRVNNSVEPSTVVFLAQSCQATAAPPVTGKMFKGLCLSYVIVIMTFFSVAISGYWAFGNQAEGSILTNFILKNSSTLVPKWFLMMTNLFVLLQLAAVGVVRTEISELPFINLFRNLECSVNLEAEEVS